MCLASVLLLRSAELLTPAHVHSAAETVPFHQAPAFAGFCLVSPGKLTPQGVSNPQEQFLSHLNQEMGSCVMCLTRSPGYKEEWEDTTPAQGLLQRGTQWNQLL